MLACFGVDDHKVLILDMRSPGVPVAELVGHQGPLSAIAWGSGGGGGGGSSTGGGWIASCGMSSRLLVLSCPPKHGEANSVQRTTASY